MTRELPFVSVIIPTRNSAKTLSACLQSLQDIDYPADRMEVIIVDGGSTDGTIGIAKNFGSIILSEEGHGPTMARIVGLRKARGEIIAFTDGDVIVEKAWLRNAVAHLADRPRTAAGGPLHADKQQAFAQALQAFFDVPEVLGIKQNHELVDVEQEAPMLPTANFVAPAKALRCVLEETWSGYGGDHMLSAKLKEQGYALIMYPDVKVSHLKRSNPAEAFEEIFRWGRGRVRAGKWKSGNPLRYALDAFLPLSVCGTVLLFLLFPTSIAIAALCVLLLPLVAEAAWAGWRSRSIAVAMLSPVAVACYVYGWSAGFLVELIIQAATTRRGASAAKVTLQPTDAPSRNEQPQMLISFVIPAFNEECYIAECLEAITSLRDSVVHEIVVIDNASTDRTAEIAATFKGVKVIRETTKGLPFARQRGLDEATGNFYAAIDADTRVSAAWLDIVKRRFDHEQTLVALTGVYRYYDLPAWKQSVIRMLMATLWIVGRAVGFAPQYACGGNTVYRMDALRAAGGFNTNISFYGEDIDTLMRVSKRGDVAFAPRLIADSSARRMNAEGFWKLLLLYRVNAIWQNMLHRPLLRQDVRDWR